MSSDHHTEQKQRSSTAATLPDPKAQQAVNTNYSGVHSFMVNACKFVVDAKYHPVRASWLVHSLNSFFAQIKALGRGAYGVVCSAVDKTTGKKVAIKKIPKAFEDLIDAKRILREVKLLRHFRHENIIGLRDLVPPIKGEPFDDMSVAFSHVLHLT